MKSKIKQLIDKFNFSQGKYSAYKIFSDIVYLQTYFILSCVIGKKEYAEHFDKLMKYYNKEEQLQMWNILLQLAELYNNQVEEKDILGEIYNKLEIQNEPLAQYFTPTDISDFMSKITRLDEDILKEQDYISFHEPACGAGGLILSYAKELRNKGYKPSKRLFVKAWDIDVLCTYITYVQLSMYDIPAIIINGDTLTLKENFRLYTPQYYLGLWSLKKE